MLENRIMISKYIIFLLTCLGLLLSPLNFATANELLVVAVQPVSKLLINVKNSAPANIISLNKSILSAEISGRVTNINAEAGDNVKKSNKLLSIDCSSYQLAKKQAIAALNVAKAQFNFATKQYKRNKLLVAKGTISRDLFEKAESNYLITVADIELKKAAIETANLAISRCNIFAPFSGQIIKRIIQKGQFVTTGSPLFEIIESNRIEVKTALSPNEVNEINNSLNLNFVANGIEATAKIRSIIAYIDEASRTQEVRLTLPSSSAFPAGLSGRLVWNSKEKKIPAEYIIRRASKLGIMIAEDVQEGVGTAKFYPLPNAQEGQAEIINLPADTFVITKNRFRVKDGQKIKIQ